MKLKTEKTYWNGEPCHAYIVKVVVGKSLRPTWWCAGLEGQQREAVRVEYGEQVFYLDNETPGWSGWDKVTKGHGSPSIGHKSLPVAFIVCNGKDETELDESITGHKLHCQKCNHHLTSLYHCPNCNTRYEP